MRNYTSDIMKCLILYLLLYFYYIFLFYIHKATDDSGMY